MCDCVSTHNCVYVSVGKYIYLCDSSVAPLRPGEDQTSLMITLGSVGWARPVPESDGGGDG